MTGRRVSGRWGLLFLAALLPRLWELDRFITADEILFLTHARDFLSGLAGGDLALTLGIGYPGVTLAWANALGLLILFGLSRLGLTRIPAAGMALSQFLDGADVQPLPYYVAGRVVTALLSTVLILLAYALFRRLLVSQAAQRPGWGDGHRQVALLCLFFLALEPYVLGYSRLMHIAVPLALLMLLAVLSWLLWLEEGRKKWLWLTGLFSGLALLTKSTALMLYPILPGLAVLYWLIGKLSRNRPVDARQVRWGQVWPGWLAVLALAVLVFFLLWPAMWVEPGKALGLTFGKLWVDREAGQGNLGMFWMGHFVEDPGPAFYIVTLLLKLSPWMLVGLAFNLVSLRLGREQRAGWGLWVYALLYLLVMTVASKKSVRYLLPAYVAFAPLGAWGLIHLARWTASLRGRRRPESVSDQSSMVGLGWRAWALVVGLLVLFALVYAPYYLSYHNPLLLGWRWAPEALLVGWGEGLADAARFLNQQPDAEQASVAAWYDWTFAPFFVGQTLPMSTENAMSADYSVFYINQVQRNIPDPNLISYFQRRRPDYVVRLHGIDYAWVYPAINSDGPPPASATRLDISMGGLVALEGYEVCPDTRGQRAIVTLYWRALRSELPDYFVYVRAVDGAGHIQARADSPPVMGFWPTSRWEAGKLVADEQILARPPETAPGVYRLEVGMYDPQTWGVLEPATGERGEGGGLLLGEVMLP